MKLLLVLTGVLLIAAVSQAEFIRVPGEYPTIQDGIDKALDGDVILVAPGTYTGARNTDLLISNFMNITIQADEGEVVIDCEKKSRGIVFRNCRSELLGITIINGWTSKSGGAVELESAFPRIEDCSFLNSYAGKNGGGMAGFGNSWPFMKNCVIEGNAAGDSSSGKGGGIYFELDGYASPHLRSCVIKGNSAFSGGGIAILDADAPKLSNCIITANSAYRGGGLFSLNATPVCLNTNLVFNDAVEGEAVWAGDGVLVKLLNAVVWGNTGSETGDVVLLNGSGQATVSYTDIEGGWEGPGNIDADPRFTDPENFDFHLLPDSPCINKGSGAWRIDLDFDGEPRPYPSGGAYDMSVDEYVPRNPAPVVQKGALN